MKTPQEIKAEELVDRFLTASFGTMEEYIPVPYKFAIQCAKIAVEEIIKTAPLYPSDVDWDDCGSTHKYYYEAQREEAEKYWHSVLECLNKM